MHPISASADLHYFPYQSEGIAFALRREGTLIADEMGLGKTVQAIGVINADPAIRTVLVVCPATMKLVWKRELEHWLNRRFEIHLVGAQSDILDARMPSVDITIINYDRLNDHRIGLLRMVWDLAIFDECHYLKNPGARRTKIATAIKAKRRVALSGTPLLNRPAELRPILSWLDPAAWPQNGWHEFGVRYCGALWNGFGWEYKGATNLEELAGLLRQTVMLRRTKKEVLPCLPCKFRSVIELAPGRDLQRLIQAELSSFERWMETVSGTSGDPAVDGYKTGVKGLHLFRGEQWSNLANARHQTALAKLPLIIEFVKELFGSGAGKIVIFAHHRDVIENLREALRDFAPVILRGDTPPTARMKQWIDLAPILQSEFLLVTSKRRERVSHWHRPALTVYLLR